jgi:hypothetical protein
MSPSVVEPSRPSPAGFGPATPDHPQRGTMTAAEHTSFVLHGRLVEGCLEHPDRNESRAGHADDLAAARVQAQMWAEAGFTVWIYDHGRPPAFRNSSDLRVVDVVRPRR